MKIDTIQTSFTGGELAPSLFGRTDVAQYANAVAELSNFLIRPYGPIISTPGTEFINACKTGGTTGIVRLIQFVFSRTDSYVIEMGVGYFRFFTDGAVVVSNSTIYEVAHTYTAAEIPDIQYCQLNDVIYLAHPNHPPARLTRYAAETWILDNFPFVGGPFIPDNIGPAGVPVSYSYSSLVVVTNGSVYITVTPTTGTNYFTVSSSTTRGHYGTYWKLGTPVTSATTGLGVQGYFQVTNVVSAWALTGSTMSTISASIGGILAEGAWSDVRGWPARVTFHQQRLFFGRTTYEPQNVWGSKSFEYDNFAVDEANDADAINLTLASNEANGITWLAPSKNLIVGTYGGEFVIKSGDESPLTPTNTNVSKETSWGSEDIIPKKIGSFFYYVQRFGMKIREIFYNWDSDSYKSADKTILSPHISGNGGFLDFAYQQNPDTVLWCVCSDGTLATMTREVDQEVQGWAKQNTLGVYESIASIPSLDSSHDEIWVVVKRTINGAAVRYVERFKSQEVPNRQDKCWYVHSGLSYDAYEESALTATASTISLSATAGTSVVVTCNTNYFAATDVGQRIRTVDVNGATIGELEITAYTGATIVVGKVKKNFNSTTTSTGYWGLSVSEISGLGHLEQATVSVLGDGGTDKPNKVVTGGTIDLAYDYFVVTVGLPYTQRVKTLSQEAGSQRGTAQGKIQRINQVAFKVNKSHKGFLCAGTDAYLERINFRDPATLMGIPESLYTGTIPNVSFRDDYHYGAQVIIENSDPLPIELLSIISTIDTNDK